MARSLRVGRVTVKPWPDAPPPIEPPVEPPVEEESEL